MGGPIVSATRISLIAFASLSLALTPDIASAQDDDDSLFEEIVVTAKRRQQSIYEVPAAISAFSAETVEKQGIKNLIDVGKFVPNLNVTGFSAGHTSTANPFIRGIGLQDHLITTDPGVSVYVDGVYLGRQVGQNWSLSNIERIEVLRGPQGTLYGRNSIGGAINLITKQPGDEEVSRVGLEVGTRGRVNGDFYSNVVVSDTLAVSVNGAFQRRNGIGEFLNVPDPEADVGELRDLSARIAARWTPTDRLTLLFAADGNDGEGGLRPYTTLIDEVPNGGVFQAGYRNSDLAADPYDNNTGQAQQTGVSNQAYGVSLTGTYDFSDTMTGQFIFSDRHSEYESGLDDDGFLDDFLSFPEVGYADQTSFELQLSGEAGAFDYVTGIYWFEEEGENDQDPTIFLGGPGTFTLGQDTESFAVFGNVGYAVSERMRVSAGLRYTEDEKDARVDINDSLIDTGASRDWDEVTWELALSYDLSDRVSAYGTVQNGYQSGQFPPRPFCLFGSLDFTQPGNVSQPNCFVANDNVTAVNYEAGLKGELLDTLQLSAAVFYTEYSDLPYQVSTTTGAGFDTQNLIVDQESFGIELEGTWAPTDAFLLHATFGYIDADVDEPGAPTAVAPLTPEITASLSPEFTTRLGRGDLRLRADWSFRDDMFGEPTSDPGRFTKIDSRELVNFDISYQPDQGNWTVGLYGRNVFDERYDNARLNTGDYVLVILSNDASEFGVRFTTEF